VNRPVRTLALAAAATLGLILAWPVTAQASTAESHTSTAAARSVYPQRGEGLISLTARACGTSAVWRSVASANRVYGPAFVIYYGRAYTVSCARPTTTTASRSTAPRTSGWVHPLPWALGHPGGCWGDARYDKYGNWRPHKGVDLVKPWGTPVRAAHAGKISFAGWNGGYGVSVEINHSGAMTRYAHLSREYVSVGQWVAKGQVIGRVGSTGLSTGPHLHFEVGLQVRISGSQTNPATYMRNRGINIGC